LAQQWRQECEHFVVCEPSRLETEDDQHGEKRLHAPVAKAQRGSTLAIDLDRLHHLIKGILTDEAIVGDLLDVQQTSIGSKADLPQSGQILQALADGEIARVVDGRLGAECASFFVILLDPRVLVIDVQGRNDAFGNDSRPEAARRSSTHFTIKNKLYLTGATDVEILPDNLLEEHAPCNGTIEHLSEGELRWQDRDFLTVPSPAISRRKRMRQLPQPFPEKSIDFLRLEPVANRL